MKWLKTGNNFINVDKIIDVYFTHYAEEGIIAIEVLLDAPVEPYAIRIYSETVDSSKVEERLPIVQNYIHSILGGNQAIDDFDENIRMAKKMENAPANTGDGYGYIGD